MLAAAHPSLGQRVEMLRRATPLRMLCCQTPITRFDTESRDDHATMFARMHEQFNRVRLVQPITVMEAPVPAVSELAFSEAPVSTVLVQMLAPTHR